MSIERASSADVVPEKRSGSVLKHILMITAGVTLTLTWVLHDYVTKPIPKDPSTKITPGAPAKSFDDRDESEPLVGTLLTIDLDDSKKHPQVVQFQIDEVKNGLAELMLQEQGGTRRTFAVDPDSDSGKFPATLAGVRREKTGGLLIMANLHPSTITGNITTSGKCAIPRKNLVTLFQSLLRQEVTVTPHTVDFHIREVANVPFPNTALLKTELPIRMTLDPFLSLNMKLSKQEK